MEIFDNREAASEHAAKLMSECLIAQLENHERAGLVVSGGNTPLSCLQILSESDLPWHRVDVTLTDEREVPPDHCDSNEKMVRENLLVGRAKSARFLRLEMQTVVALQPFTCTLVGMGEDGHFASLFPDSPQLAEGLQSKSEILRVSTPSSPYARISMTLSSIINSRVIILLVFGDAKRRILERTEDYPVHHLLGNASVATIWSP